MRDFVNFIRHYFGELSFQGRSGILFLICFCGLGLIFPNGELWPIVMVFGAASGLSLMCNTRTSEPDEPESPAISK